jgi:hypothetical protein
VTLTQWLRGSLGETKTYRKNTLFTQLRAVQEQATRLKHTKPRHRSLGSLVGDPGGARYKCGGRKERNRLPFLPVAPQPCGRGRVGKKEQGRDKPAGHNHHASKGMKESPGTATPPPNLRWLFKVVYRYGEKLEVVLGARVLATQNPRVRGSA